MKQKVLKTKVKIRFQDCDPFNHLNNGKYIDYFLNAREDQVLDEYDLDIFNIARTERVSWVVVDHKISFIKPAFTMETVTITTQLINFSKRSITVEMKMHDENENYIKAVMWTTFVLIDMESSKPAIHKPEYLELFESVVVPVEANNFNDRVKYLKSNTVLA